MPYKSSAQQRFMHAQHPDIAARWDKHTSKKQFTKLPQHVKKADAAHWSDKLVGHHQSRIGYHQAQIDRLSTFKRVKPTALKPQKPGIGKRLPGETKNQAVTRHQRQLGGLFTTAAAVPAILGVRTGIKGAKLAEGAQKTALATRQLQHGATAIGLGAIGSGIGSAPVPKRIFSVNPKHNKRPRIHPSGVTHRGLGKPPASGYDNSGVGKRLVLRDGVEKALSPGFDEHTVRQRFRATEQVRAGQTARRQAKGFGGAGTKPHYNPSSAQRAASFARREDQAVTHASRAFTRVPSAAPALRSHIAGGQVRDAAIAGAAVAGGLSYLHHQKINKATQDREREAAGAAVGAGAVRGTSVVGGQSAKAGLKIHRAKVGSSPVDENVWSRHKASHGVAGPLNAQVPNATKVKIGASYPKSLPGWRTQRLLAHKNRPSVTAATIGLGAIGGAAAAHRRNAMNKRLTNRDAGNLATIGTGTTLGGAGLLGAGKQVRQNTIRVAGKHVMSGNLPGAVTHGVKGLKTATGLERAGAAGIGAGALAGGYALSQRKRVKKGEDMSVDAWGIVRDDLVEKALPAVKRAQRASYTGAGVGATLGAGIGGLATRKPSGAAIGALAGTPVGSTTGLAVNALRPKIKKIEKFELPTGLAKLPKIGLGAAKDAGAGLKTGIGGKTFAPRGPAGSGAHKIGTTLRTSPLAQAGAGAGAVGLGAFGANKMRKPKAPSMPGMSKAMSSPLPQAEAAPTVDGHGGFVFGDPGIAEFGDSTEVTSAIFRAVGSRYPQPVAKNYYYGSAPAHRQHGEGAAVGTAAFTGALAGAGGPKAAAKAKPTALKLKRAGRAAVSTLRAG